MKGQVIKRGQGRGLADERNVGEEAGEGRISETR